MTFQVPEAKKERKRKVKKVKQKEDIKKLDWEEYHEKRNRQEVGIPYTRSPAWLSGKAYDLYLAGPGFEPHLILGSIHHNSADSVTKSNLVCIHFELPVT